MGGRVSEVIDGERRWKAPVTSAALLYYREENADVPILVHVESPPGSDVGEAAIDAQEFQAVACRSLLARFW